ncbi:MAG: hypothetical protein GYB67_10910 [Chloroflexi bacterium]|nr:hypothetical protein [Chloroflexota bacterium]
MPDNRPDRPPSYDDVTIPSRSTAARQRANPPTPSEHSAPTIPNARQSAGGEGNPVYRDAPWLIQRFLNEKFDLDAELAQRFGPMPLLSVAKFRTFNERPRRDIATLTTQDDSARLLIEVDVASKDVQLVYGFGGMLGMRFRPERLTNKDRLLWLETLRRQTGETALLWSQAQWRSDYVIGAAHTYHTHLYSFSHQRQLEAGVRLRSDTAIELLTWLDRLWKSDLENSSPHRPW